jgi:hypothetical protein
MSGLAVAATAPRYAAASDAAKTVAPPADASCAPAKSKAHAAPKTSAAAKTRAASTATAADAASTATAPSASSTATTAAAATAATPDELYAGSQCCDVFFVEDVERRQADVGDFLLGESDFVAQSSVRRRHIRCRPTGCAARQRERQTGGPQHRQSFAPALSLRSLLRARHRGHLHTFGQCSDRPFAKTIRNPCPRFHRRPGGPAAQRHFGDQQFDYAVIFYGALGEIRTPDPQIRSLSPNANAD